MKEMIKEKIFDYVYDELEISEVYEIEKILEKDKELKEYYLQLKNEKDSVLDKNIIFKNVDDEFLEEQRDLLFSSLTQNSDKDKDENDEEEKGNVVKFNFNKSKIVKITTEFVKYAAVIMLTFYVADINFNTPDTTNGFTNNAVANNKIKSVYPKNIIQPVSYNNNENENSILDGNKNLNTLSNTGEDDYSIKNISVSQDDSDIITLDFDISTHKTVTGKRNDPIIEYTLDQIMKNEKNLGVKLRTLKAIGKTSNSKLQATLIEVMLNQKEDMIIRKKAMKMLVKNPINPEIESALVEIVKSESDQAFRIEALNTLESIDTKVANSSLKEINSTDEYLKYKASIVDKE